MANIMFMMTKVTIEIFEKNSSNRDSNNKELIWREIRNISLKMRTKMTNIMFMMTKVTIEMFEIFALLDE